MVTLKDREPRDSSNLSMVKIYLAQDWIVPWALTFFDLEAAIMGFNQRGALIIWVHPPMVDCSQTHWD